MWLNARWRESGGCATRWGDAGPHAGGVAHCRKNASENQHVCRGQPGRPLFLREGLVDEIRLFVMPLALGRGVPLFAPPVPEERWELAEVKRWQRGVAELHYVKG